MKIIFVVSEDWYFLSHRLPLAVEAKERGWEVLVACRMGAREGELKREGFRPVPLALERGGTNPLKDWQYYHSLVSLYRAEHPDIVHHVAMKPCLYGSLAALRAKVPGVVNALPGLGFLFSSSSAGIKMLRHFTMALFKRLFRRSNSRLILQNQEDVGFFQDVVGIPSARVRLIPGSGVDLAVFHPPSRPAPDRLSPPLFMMVSRLLKDKGVIELIKAAGIARESGVSFQVALVGIGDTDNRNAVADEALQLAAQAKLVKLYGRRTDIEQVYADADVAVLPSYREGTPKALLEAMACGLPIITTDVPGCSTLVRGIHADTVAQTDGGHRVSHGAKIGTNGILVPPQNAGALAEAIGILASDPELRSKMGRNSRLIAEAEFGIDRIVRLTFNVYEELVRPGVTVAPTM